MTSAVFPNSIFYDSLVSPESQNVGQSIRRLKWRGWESGTSTSYTVAEWIVHSNPMEQRFGQLAKTWREECAHLSSIREIVIHPAYQQIVGMGRDALPFILRDLEAKPDHWFWALRAITQEDPVLQEHRGDIAQMARDWMEWAKRRDVRW